jgi:hypothetical protein
VDVCLFELGSRSVSVVSLTRRDLRGEGRQAEAAAAVMVVIEQKAKTRNLRAC